MDNRERRRCSRDPQRHTDLAEGRSPFPQPRAPPAQARRPRCHGNPANRPRARPRPLAGSRRQTREDGLLRVKGLASTPPPSGSAVPIGRALPGRRVLSAFDWLPLSAAYPFAVPIGRRRPKLPPRASPFPLLPLAVLPPQGRASPAALRLAAGPPAAALPPSGWRCGVAASRPAPRARAEAEAGAEGSAPAPPAAAGWRRRRRSARWARAPPRGPRRRVVGRRRRPRPRRWRRLAPVRCRCL